MPKIAPAAEKEAAQAPGARRVIRLYYGFQFFFSMLLWVPVFYDYQKRIGLDDAQIFRIQSIYYIAFCLMEIPTGFLADAWGHRLCMKAGSAILVAANLLPVLVPGYAGFLAHFLLVALSRSFISGASSAYLYDYLKEHGATDAYKRAEGNARSYGLIGKVLCWAAIGAVMEWHLTLPYWLTAGFSAVAVAYALALPPVPKAQGARSPIGRSQAWRQLGPVLGLLRRSPSLILIMLQGVALFVLARICTVNLYQPVLASKALPLSSYGAIMSAMTIFEAIGSACPHWMRRWWSDLNSVYLLTIVMGVSVAGLAFGGQAAVVTWFCVFSLAAGLSFPIQRQLLNDAIRDSRYRATLLSIESLLDRAVCAWVASLMGAYVAGGQVNAFLKLSGMASLASVAVVWAVMRVYRQSGGIRSGPVLTES